MSNIRIWIGNNYLINCYAICQNVYMDENWLSSSNEHPSKNQNFYHTRFATEVDNQFLLINEI